MRRHILVKHGKEISAVCKIRSRRTIEDLDLGQLRPLSICKKVEQA